MTIGIVCIGLFAFPYFGLLNTSVAGLVLLAIVLSLVLSRALAPWEPGWQRPAVL